MEEEDAWCEAYVFLNEPVCNTSLTTLGLHVFKSSQVKDYVQVRYLIALRCMAFHNDYYFGLKNVVKVTKFVYS